jgi:hypothetical protein
MPTEMKDYHVRVIPSEVSEAFLQGMADRMSTSYHKYGRVADSMSDHVASLEKRLERYREDGNTEWLMDAANFAMIEFMNPRHPRAHYRPTDSGESPGRILPSGRGTQESHAETAASSLSGSMAKLARGEG